MVRVLARDNIVIKSAHVADYALHKGGRRSISSRRIGEGLSCMLMLRPALCFLILVVKIWVLFPISDKFFDRTGIKLVLADQNLLDLFIIILYWQLISLGE